QMIKLGTPLVGQDGIPPNWLGNLGTKKAPRSAFNLLGDGARFYQERRTRHKWRPIGDLLVEFPTETKIAHFRHVRDGQYGFCPGCCALDIVRFCAFANRAGRGYTEGVNGPTPAYKLVAGGTLLETLLAHWPNTVHAVRNPPWCDPSPPSRQDLDALAVLAWRSRRIWLGTPEEGGVCAHCGQQGSIIRTLEFGGGWKPPEGSGRNQEQFWRDDPHLILVHRTSESEFEDQPAGAEAGEQTAQPTKRKRGGRATTLRFPVPGRPVMAHVGLWRRVLAALAIDG
ncbi:MAG: type I-E CRISPR-associated protein Cse1/CasA, partial [Bryobacteraceae bacterium]|nr:type I-E CRISPR-associated protein Cse1/CasA [Bryobacteraceae bacterium]